MKRYITEIDIILADRQPWSLYVRPGTCFYYDGQGVQPSLFVRYNSIHDYKIACDGGPGSKASGIISSHEGIECDDDSPAAAQFAEVFGLHHTFPHVDSERARCAYCGNEIHNYAYAPQFVFGNFHIRCPSWFSHLECIARNPKALPVNGHPVYEQAAKYPELIVRVGWNINRRDDYRVWFEPHVGMVFPRVFGVVNYQPDFEIEGPFTYRGAWEAFCAIYPGFPAYPFIR